MDEKAKASGEEALNIFDLTATEEEIRVCNVKIEQIINSAIEEVISGRKKLWEIESDYIRLSLDEECISSTYYHREGTTEDFYEIRIALERKIFKELIRRLKIVIERQNRNDLDPEIAEVEQRYNNI